MSPGWGGEPGLVGKAPWGPEYLPVPTHSPSFASFDSWLTLASEWAELSAGPEWPVAFQRGPIHGFVFHDPLEAAERVLCGAISPSRDSAGRMFPLAFGVPLTMPFEVLQRPELAPLTLEEPWAVATNALIEALSDAVGMARAKQTAARPSGDWMGAAALYDQWASELPLVEWWMLLGPALANPAATLRFIFEALAPFRGLEPAATSLSLRLPLGQAGGVALCFWLDIVRRSLGWQRTLPSLLWSHDGQTGAAILSLGRLSKAALAELWLPTGARDDIADLTRATDPEQVQPFSALAPGIEAVIADPRASVAQLLGEVG